ncbi:serine O-acetyltransferase EpsC [Lichenibacterium dinghuense]|uniref:serine O-acetyltransferase EpsC n=1 Tax=Lichenibacterium dinghuense TaxID=2895977 RepID=UPI001F2D1CE8|nr:serine O-acetyltransferase EpsC [Lichenibacterium sp. 6Y81]
MLDSKLQRRAGFGLSSPAPMSRYDIDGVATALRLSRDHTHNIRHGGRIRPMPSRDALAGIVADLSAALFPSHYGQSQSGAAAFDGFVCGTLSTALGLLEDQVRLGLAFADEDLAPAGGADGRALDITRSFAAALPEVRARLVGDLRAALDADPAASSAPEILLGYPGMAALLHHRLAHVLHGLGAGFPARLISDVARSLTGIEIHPGATVGDSFFIDHGTGVVIGETAIVGDRVRLHQGVTLGGRHAPAGTSLRGVQRHPILEDDVVVYANATLLGRITVGRGSIIGGNVCLNASVPPGSRVTQASASRNGAEAQRLSD